MSEQVTVRVCSKLGLAQLFITWVISHLDRSAGYLYAGFALMVFPETSGSQRAGERVTQIPTRRNGLCMAVYAAPVLANWLSTELLAMEGS